MLPFVRRSVTRCSRSTRTFSLAAMLLGTTLFGTSAAAQVGHLPSNSPYEDLKVGQDVTFFLGQFNSNRGPAKVLPNSSLFGGVRYDVPIGGPGYFTARYSFIPSERNLLLPSKPRTTRVLSVENTKTHIVDVGFTIALPGRKTWHRLVPSLQIGTGLASDFTKADTGGYQFGTKFAFTGGFNMKYMFRNNWAVRADATNYLWRNSYPDSYYTVASDTTRVLTTDISKKSWGGTWAWSLGMVIPIFR
ncbi:MAG: hypothetical protein ABI120_15655 [Gemmatimonadaceae bacterium]